MMSLMTSLIYLTFGVIIISILRRINLRLGLKTVLRNSFFWLTLISLAVLLVVISPVSTTVNAASDPTEVDSVGLPLPPSSVPPSSDGWANLAAELAEIYSGANYAIYAEDLRDSQRKITVNAEVEMPTASVYKLAIAYSMLKAVAKGMSWETSLSDTTLSTCFDRMIIDSNNECAHAWGSQHGWATVMSEFTALGLSINLYEQTTATARDIAGFLKKVYLGQVLNDELIDKLLVTMTAQRYRQGIPTGVPGKVVANKVGFMNGVLNDAGIIFSPDGDYVLVIFTNGYSWASIAETARLIDTAY
jgi:beta-lactamase class A